MSSLPRSLALSFLLLISLTTSAQYNIKKLMEEGRSTLEAGLYLSSMQLFGRVVSLKPQVHESWYLMALSKYHLEEYDGATKDCTEAIKLNPYMPEYFDLRAMIALRTEHYDSAAVDYTHAIDLQPDNRDYWYNRAYSYYYAGQTQLALQQLDYIVDRWHNFRQAKQLRREVASGRQPQPGSPRVSYRWRRKLSLQK